MEGADAFLEEGRPVQRLGGLNGGGTRENGSGSWRRGQVCPVASSRWGLERRGAWQLLSDSAGP